MTSSYIVQMWVLLLFKDLFRWNIFLCELFGLLLMLLAKQKVHLWSLQWIIFYTRTLSKYGQNCIQLPLLLNLYDVHRQEWLSFAFTSVCCETLILIAEFNSIALVRVSSQNVFQIQDKTQHLPWKFVDLGGDVKNVDKKVLMYTSVIA